MGKILMLLRATFGRHRVRLRQLLKLYKYYSSESLRLRQKLIKSDANNIGKDGLIVGSAPDDLVAITAAVARYFTDDGKHKVVHLADEHTKIAVDVFDKNFRSLCEKYFGEPVVLHNIVACRAVKSKTSSLASDSWHYDLAGNRLKIFVVLENTKGGVGTELVLGTNCERRIPHFALSRKSSALINKIYKEKVITHIGKANTFYVFDTNMWHRGDFSQKNNTLKSERLTIQYDVVTEAKYTLMSELGFPKVGFDVNIYH